MKNIFIILVFSVLIISCNNSKNKEHTIINKEKETNNHPGKKLMEINCYTCHSPSANENNRIAPPMIAIKKQYINSHTTKEQFIADMQAWIKNPNENNAKMFGAIKRFGVMPKQPYPEETIKQIADFMYDFDIEQPEWFDAHYSQERGLRLRQQGQSIKNQQAEANFQDIPYGERGLKYALATKAVLGKNLMGTIQKQGTLEALIFCNEKASPLTDSMSIANHAIIKRVSDKPRNKNNQANSKELVYINSFKADIKNQKEPKPIVSQINNKVHVFYPITTNTMCLQCHGKPNQDIKIPTLTKLKNLYPQDKAIGYDINEVRGIWNVSFDK
ncbi:cytochrome c family protein [Pseudalgibacter alginicilyticus]|uniref:Cytochrome c family protein n=1 Tax=Pseudalgibacter alginicilyticus TaxID=1736674 RepID=A0A0P0D6D9_9FLAO|nr:DUF3365 domain-containing protein [Pseudalgibacter alginicilyticus]ALJ04252.1 cytochrome c family protein [Pseudalgibacter alginicilyticus]